MIRSILVISLAAFVAGCGADGMPTRPEAKNTSVAAVEAAAAQLPE